MNISLDFFDQSFTQSLAIVPFTLRDTVRLKVPLVVINTLFTFRNGNYYFDYNEIFKGLYSSVVASPTLTSALPLNEDVLQYATNGDPLDIFTNTTEWVTYFETTLNQQFTALDAAVERFDKNTVNPDPDLVQGSDSLYYFYTHNPKNLAYIVATALNWQPSDDPYIPDTTYAITLGAADTISFKLRCSFVPTTIAPIYYSIQLKMSFVLVYVHYSVQVSVIQDPNTSVELFGFSVIPNGVLPPNTYFAGWLVEETPLQPGSNVFMSQPVVVASSIILPL
jgi:hypothetical protein